MAWTNPLATTWPIGELENATKLNLYDRDNQRLVSARYVYKTQDEALNSTTLQNDDELFMYMNSSQDRLVRIWLVWDDDSVGTFGKFKVGFSGPASMTLVLTAMNRDTTNAVARQGIDSISDVVSFQPGTNQQNNLVIIEGRISTFTTPGFVRLQWAQSVGVATDTILRRGSMIQYINPSVPG